MEDGPLGGEAGVADGTDDEVDVAARVAHGLWAVEVDEAEVAGTLGAATGADDAPPLARERTREERAEEALRAEHEHAARVVSVEVGHRGVCLVRYGRIVDDTIVWQAPGPTSPLPPASGMLPSAGSPTAV